MSMSHRLDIAAVMTQPLCFQTQGMALPGAVTVAPDEVQCASAVPHC